MKVPFGTTTFPPPLAEAAAIARTIACVFSVLPSQHVVIVIDISAEYVPSDFAPKSSMLKTRKPPAIAMPNHQRYRRPVRSFCTNMGICCFLESALVRAQSMQSAPRPSICNFTRHSNRKAMVFEPIYTCSDSADTFIVLDLSFLFSQKMSASGQCTITPRRRTSFFFLFGRVTETPC